MNWKKFKILCTIALIILAMAVVPFIGVIFSGTVLFTAATAFLTVVLALPSLGILYVGFKILQMVNNELNNPVLADEIDQLPPAKECTLLTKNEIDAFNECIKSKPEAEQKLLQKKLQQYQDYIQDCCAISLEPLKELKDPLTVEATKSHLEAKSITNPVCKTYSAQEIKKLVEIEREDAKDPVLRYDLNDRSKVKLYHGFPTWIYDFIAAVRSIISPTTKHREILLPKDARREFTRKQRESFYAQHSALFKKQDAGLKHQPPAINIPRAPLPHGRGSV